MNADSLYFILCNLTQSVGDYYSSCKQVSKQQKPCSNIFYKPFPHSRLCFFFGEWGGGLGYGFMTPGLSKDIWCHA